MQSPGLNCYTFYPGSMTLIYSKRHNKFLFPAFAETIYGNFCKAVNEISNVVNNRIDINWHKISKPEYIYLNNESDLPIYYYLSRRLFIIFGMIRQKSRDRLTILNLAIIDHLDHLIDIMALHIQKFVIVQMLFTLL